MENQDAPIEVESEAYSVVEYNDISATIEEIRAQTDFEPDMSTPEGYEKSKRLSLDIGKGLTKLEKIRKREKEYWTNGGNKIDAEAKEIKEEIEQYQLPHKEAYKGEDQRTKEELAEAETKLQQLIRMTSTARSDRWSSEKILEAIDKLKADDCGGYGVKASDAIIQKPNVVAGLEAFRVEVIKAEQDAEELAELRRRKAVEEDQEIPPQPITNAVSEVIATADQAAKNIGKAFAIPDCKKCEMLIGVIESMHRKHREFMLLETLADEDELPEYENSVEKKRVDGIMNQ